MELWQGVLKISYGFSPEDRLAALSKLTDAALRYDRERGNSLAHFDGTTLTPIQVGQRVTCIV